MSIKNAEAQLRRLAARKGYTMTKFRHPNEGGPMYRLAGNGHHIDTDQAGLDGIRELADEIR